MWGSESSQRISLGFGKITRHGCQWFFLFPLCHYSLFMALFTFSFRKWENRENINVWANFPSKIITWRKQTKPTYFPPTEWWGVMSCDLRTMRVYKVMLLRHLRTLRAECLFVWMPGCFSMYMQGVMVMVLYQVSSYPPCPPPQLSVTLHVWVPYSKTCSAKFPGLQVKVHRRKRLLPVKAEAEFSKCTKLCLCVLHMTVYHQSSFEGDTSASYL